MMAQPLYTNAPRTSNAAACLYCALSLLIASSSDIWFLILIVMIPHWIQDVETKPIIIQTLPPKAIMVHNVLYKMENVTFSHLCDSASSIRTLKRDDSNLWSLWVFLSFSDNIQMSDVNFTTLINFQKHHMLTFDLLESFKRVPCDRFI
jgi:hypothetical protein